MNPSEHESDDVQPIADQNTERLLAGAYRPEKPDPAYIAQVTAAMRAVAAQRAEPDLPMPVARPRSTATRWVAWLAAASVLVAVGVVAGAMFLGRPGFQRQDGTVWINGRAYVEAERAENDSPEKNRRPWVHGTRAGLQPVGVPPGHHVPMVGGNALEQPAAGTAAPQPQGAGTVARPLPVAAAAEVLQVGQSAETGSDQRRRLALADGSILYLNHDTAVTLTAARQVTLRRGEIYVEVAQDPAAARFIVNTPRKQMIALGTKFDVCVAPASAELQVTQGKVQVSDRQSPVLAGQQLTLDGSADISAAPRATHTIHWTRDLMAATRGPLVPGSRYSGGSLVALDSQGQETRLSLRKYHVDVHIEDGFARTTIDQTYFNHESARLEGTFYFPLPPDASLSRLAMYVNGRLMEGGMAERQHAREVFESIVTRMKDPALLEWVDGSTFKMRVFPLEGRQEKRIILSYTQHLPSLYGRSEYRFPGGHSLPTVGDWSVHVRVKDGAGEKGRRGEGEKGRRGEGQGVECEPQLTATTIGNDLLLDATAKDIRPDRDVVIRLNAPQYLPAPLLPRSPSPLLSFSSAVSDGSKYLMLRWQPELPAEKQRQRRDWIFLFESSADRDPLLARAQVEIVKTILDNAEHDDTFSVLTAATRMHAYDAKPQTATPANVKLAVGFLENVHLIGALDLGRALDAVRPLAEAAENPVLVHVGSGLPVLGQRDVDELVQRVPRRAAYVGIGVGNRWSRALMKAATARNGGIFTQINPNEQIGWRALDLLATFNTPRLLGIRVSGAAGASQAGKPDLPGVQFLACEDALAQGEQLCAIARVDVAADLPKAVEVTGQLNGKPRKWTLPVAGVADQALYLPRTWAKLEIDRLVADGAEKNKARIIELSKAMYVMSPFTSLLVLENEEMYVQYNVDRGRKDHWAMYACPERIAVVTESPLIEPDDPFSQKADPFSPKKSKGPTAEEVLATILVRVPLAILGRRGEFSALEEQWQKDVQNTVNKARSQVTTDPAKAAAIIQNKTNDLIGERELRPEIRERFMAMLHRAAREIKHRGDEITFKEQQRIHEEMAQKETEATNMALIADQTKVKQLMDRYDSLMAEGRYHLAEEAAVEADKVFDRELRSAEPTARVALQRERIHGAFDDIMAIRIAKQKGFVDAMYQIEKSHVPTADDPPIFYPDAQVWKELAARRHEIFGRTKAYPVADLILPMRDPDDVPIVYPDAELWKELTARRKERFGSADLPKPSPAERKIEEALKQPTQIEFVDTPLKDILDYLKDLHHIEIQLDSAAMKEEGVDEAMRITKNLKGISLRSGLNLLLDELRLTYIIHNEVLLITTRSRAESEELSGYRPDLAERIRRILPGYNRKVPLYQPPVFGNNPAVFYDLVSYAAGMDTTLADVLAVLEAEARPEVNVAKPGKIDDRARRLIERARGAGWQTATIAEGAGKSPLSVAFDGTGRYRYERITSTGLREVVICDGTSLWHLYRELGIGARRTLSRFHRQDFTRLLPWALPPVEDLACGADIVSIGERTVAIVPHDNLPSPVIGRGAGGEGGSKPRVLSLRTRLVFAADGRLAERQLVEMPAGKIRAHESYAADGTVEFVAGEKEKAGGTPAPRRNIKLAPCGAPELKPSADLVVLPLPLRDRWSVREARKLFSDESYDKWSEDDALALIAADLGEAPDEMKQIIGQRFFHRGDRRLGFYTLLLSSGQTWNPREKQDFGGPDPLLADPLIDHPKDPLARYVAGYLGKAIPPVGNVLRGVPNGEGSSPVRNAVEKKNAAEGVAHSDFFGQLAEFHELWDPWRDDQVTARNERQQRRERERAIAFIQHTPSPEMAWGLLMAIRGTFGNCESPDGFAPLFKRFETVPELKYAARYEQGRALLNAGWRFHAQEIFCKLFAETLDAGSVPPIDSAFREALLQGDNGGRWHSTIRAAAKRLIDTGDRPSAVYLACEVQQAGDPALAEELLEMVAREAPEGQRFELKLARIELFRQMKQLPRADALLQTLLEDKRYNSSPALWYLAEAIADARGRTARAISFRQRAMEIECEHLPEEVNVELIRSDYGQLLARYEKLVAAIGPLRPAGSGELVAEVICAADRWRQFDPDPTTACQAAARILGELGETDLAWDYLTTPLCVAPYEASGWADLARTLRQQGQVDLADRAYAAACEADPVNAQILWDRAELLWENGRREQARPLFQKIAAGPWGPRFADLQSRARQYVGK